MLGIQYGLLVAASVVFVPLALVGCGGDDEKTRTTSGSLQGDGDGGSDADGGSDTDAGLEADAG
jgi:hypothetical protein